LKGKMDEILGGIQEVIILGEMNRGSVDC